MTYSPPVDGNAKLYLALVVAAVPGLAAIALFDYFDRKRPEPLATRWKVLAAGMFSVLPVLWVDEWILRAVGDAVPARYTYNGSMFQAFVMAAGVEELLKISVIYWIVWHRPEFDERMDGLIYGARAGLGFAILENFFYLWSQPTLDAVIHVGILRAVLAVPGHAMWTAMIGYAAARARFDRKGLGFVGGYLLAVALHGIYDYAVFATVPMELEGAPGAAKRLLIVPPVVIVACVLIVRRMARTALRLDDADAAHRMVPVPVPVPPAAPS
jgi:protease PrsW